MKNIVLIFTCLLFVGCALPFSEKVPPERSYHLSLPAPTVYSETPIAQSMRIAVVNIGVGLRTDRIIAVNNYELLPIMGSHWAENTAELLEKTLTRHFSRKQMFSRVTSDPLGRSADWVLELDVQEFYLILDQGKPESVRISFFAQLKSNANREVLISGVFGKESSLDGSDTQDVVAAFSETLAALVAQLESQIAELEV